MNYRYLEIMRSQTCESHEKATAREVTFPARIPACPRAAVIQVFQAAVVGLEGLGERYAHGAILIVRL